MLTPEQMISAVEAYRAGFENEDLPAIMALFAEDAIVDDPVGTPARHGHAEISAFFAGSLATGARLTLDGPCRVGPDYVAFPFHVDLAWQGTAMRVDVIDVFHFDAAGRIVRMQAFFGDTNFVPVSQGG